MRNPLVSIIILVHNSLECTQICIESVKKSKTNVPYELIIIDNDSDLEMKKYLSGLKYAKLVKRCDQSIVKGRNEGIRLSSTCSKYCCLLDNDVVVCDFWIDDLVSIAESDSKIGVIGTSSNVRMFEAVGFPRPLREEWSQFCETCGSISPKQKLAKFYRDGFMNFANKERLKARSRTIAIAAPPDYIPSWCMFFRKNSDLVSRSTIDPTFSGYTASDIDLSWTIASKGYKLIYTEKVYIHHFKSQSLRFQNPESALKRFYSGGYALLAKKWSKEIIKYLSSKSIEKNNATPYLSGELVKYITQTLNYFSINSKTGKWKLNLKSIDDAFN